MRSGEVRIREAKPGDLGKVAAMHYPVWRQSWDGMLAPYLLDMLDTPKRWVQEFYPLTLKRGGWSMWIAEKGRQPLGMALFGPDLSNPELIQLDALYIAEASQRLGLGGRLLDTALHLHPGADMILWCAEKNRKAREFYEGKNFRLDGRSYVWKPLPGVKVPHVGYRLYRSASGVDD
nr:GNAT family N-acetyltransferase [Mycobacterium kubicae]